MALLSHFPSLSFAVVAFDNSDHPDKNSLSENAIVQDPAVTVFQEKPDKPLWKQLKNESPLNNVTTLAKMPRQQLIQYSEVKNLKFQESFSIDKEVLRCERRSRSRIHNAMCTISKPTIMFIIF